MEKSEFRRKCLEIRKNLPKIKADYGLLKNDGHYKAAKTVFCYVSTEDEIDTFELLSYIAAEKTLVVPCCTDKCGNMISSEISSVKELHKGTFGIYEPKNPTEFDKTRIDFVILPGVAFDKEGFRIGCGKGYYDRFLSDISVYKAAFCRRELYFDTVPHAPYDVPADRVFVI